MIVATAKRHAIEITQDALVIRHSFYTLAIERHAVQAVQARAVSSMDELGLSTRTNGIAAFGYLSGWFRGVRGERIFCACSQWPVYLITFDGRTRCRQLALSTTPEIARNIEVWAAS
jgi:hypothetical protein